ncbi:hypothetical protein DEO72_LG11g948 [Vigna unguiculata]|uniref:Uncharacterized protein n=1 Tax=Vigna unguiculata TaxID=3917 RepID=A0A4D6NJH9_VIGUN|nr:hypothetical protein DEO72_LG11g948 [Vigna unguiculata]
MLLTETATGADEKLAISSLHSFFLRETDHFFPRATTRRCQSSSRLRGSARRRLGSTIPAAVGVYTGAHPSLNPDSLLPQERKAPYALRFAATVPATKTGSASTKETSPPAAATTTASAQDSDSPAAMPPAIVFPIVFLFSVFYFGFMQVSDEDERKR